MAMKMMGGMMGGGAPGESSTGQPDMSQILQM